MLPANSKGKGKAIERTPLLDEHGHPTGEAQRENQYVESSQPAAISRPPMRQAWRSHLLTAALVVLTICFALLLTIILLAHSYAAPALRNINNALSQPGGDKFWKDAVALRGPDAINIVGVDRAGDEKGVSQLQMNMSITMRMTIDTDFVMGFREDSAEVDGWWARKWKDLGRWGIRRVGSTTAVLQDIIIYPSSSAVPFTPLLTIKPLSPIPISLSPGLSSMDRAASLSALTPVTISFIVRPSPNASFLLDFVEKSWARASISVRLHGSGLQVYGGHEYLRSPTWRLGRWRNWLKLEKSEVALGLKLPIPPLHIPSHPPTKPGSGLPALSDLLTLESFTITSSPSPVTPQPVPPSTPTNSQSNILYAGPDSLNVDAFRDQKVLGHDGNSISSTHPDDLQFILDAWNVIIAAQASIAHPFSTLASKLDLDMPPFPLMVALPTQQGKKSPVFELSYIMSEDHFQTDIIPVAQVYARPSFNVTHIRIPLSGYLLPLSNSSGLGDAISAFASAYLSYKPAAIAVFTPLYPSLVVHASFPPPSTRLELLRNVTIENMSIRPGLGSIFVPDSLTSRSMDPALSVMDILASATVHARVVLPPGMNIDVRVKRLWIDCFVFDGEVPPDGVAQDAGWGRNHITGEAQPAPISGADDPPVPNPRPLPSPLPERAFARITPKTWLNASSSRVSSNMEGTSNRANEDDNNDSGTNVYVTAELVDIPLEVLPGRGNELSKFVTKVLFSNEPAVAGIRGVATVGVGIPGLTTPSSEPRVEGSELIITGLPFQGNVRVGGGGS